MDDFLPEDTIGIPEKEFQAIIDHWISGNGAGRVDRYFDMSDFQQSVMQIIKKAQKRVAYKANKKKNGK